jgi:hypothetical protein
VGTEPVETDELGGYGNPDAPLDTATTNAAMSSDGTTLQFNVVDSAGTPMKGIHSITYVGKTASPKQFTPGAQGSIHVDPAYSRVEYWAEATNGALQPPQTLYKYPTTVLADGPVAYYRLGERVGTTVYDEAPAQNHGTYVAAAYRQPGLVPGLPLARLGNEGAILHDPDTAASFYYTNLNPPPNPKYNFIQVPHNKAQEIKSKLTLEVWFTMKPGIQTYSALISKSSSNWQGDGYGIYNYAGSEYFFINHINIRVGVPVAVGPDYHHIVGTYDGQVMKIYLDGALAGERPYNAPINHSMAPLLIGQGYLLGWVGNIDEVAIYDRALSDREVEDHFRVGKGLAPRTP